MANNYKWLLTKNKLFEGPYLGLKHFCFKPINQFFNVKLFFKKINIKWDVQAEDAALVAAQAEGVAQEGAIN